MPTIKVNRGSTEGGAGEAIAPLLFWKEGTALPSFENERGKVSGGK